MTNPMTPAATGGDETLEVLTEEQARERYQSCLDSLGMTRDELDVAYLNYELNLAQRATATRAYSMDWLLGGDGEPCCWRCYEKRNR